MANEISIKASLDVVKGYLSHNRQVSFKADIATAKPNVAAGSQAIGTSPEAITYGDVTSTTGAVAWFRNLDDTNYVEIGAFVNPIFYPIIRLLPGEAYPIRIGSSLLYGQAHTAAVNLEKNIFDA